MELKKKTLAGTIVEALDASPNSARGIHEGPLSRSGYTYGQVYNTLIYLRKAGRVKRQKVEDPKIGGVPYWEYRGAETSSARAAVAAADKPIRDWLVEALHRSSGSEDEIRAKVVAAGFDITKAQMKNSIRHLIKTAKIKSTRAPSANGTYLRYSLK
jgi:hypothetical protein